jgi:threonine dehydrogenase-like Zn-dependent dehydrogenase
MNARVIALDISPERLDRAKEFGAEETLDPSKDDAVQAIRDLTRGEGADMALDCSSAPTARLASVQCVKTWGKACFVGEGGEVTLDVSRDMLRRQVTIVGSWTFSLQGQADCAQFIIDHKLDVDHLFTHRFRLEEAVDAYRLFDTQTTGKGVFEL